jgi:hypothetical protein
LVVFATGIVHGGTRFTDFNPVTPGLTDELRQK